MTRVAVQHPLLLLGRADPPAMLRHYCMLAFFGGDPCFWWGRYTYQVQFWQGAALATHAH